METKREFRATIAHDYVRICEEENGKETKRVSLPIDCARRLFTEIMKHDYLQENHTEKYSHLTYCVALNIRDTKTFFHKRYEYRKKEEKGGDK